MPNPKSQNRDIEVAETLKTMLIAQLGLAGVPQKSVRKIVGCDMNRVTKVMRHLPRANARDS